MMNEWILSSSILIAAVLLGRQLIRGRIRARLQYALWGVVLIRLLLPVQLFTSDFGAGTIAREVDISAPVREVYLSANEDRYEREYAEAYRYAASVYESAGQSADPIVIEQTAREMARETIELDLKALLKDIWLVGMGAMTAVIAACNLHLSRQLQRRRREYPAAECLLPVYVTEVLPTPCIFGIFRPVVYLTPEAAADGQLRHHVLVHEQTHYRHADHIWSVLRSICLVLHWYNPLVWLAVKASKTDAELACDEGVLARLGEGERGDYGRTLIGLTCAAPMGDYLLTATTMTGSAGSIRQRIRLLMARPRNTLLALTAVVLIGTIVVGCAFSGAPQATEPEPTIPREPAESAPGTDSDFLRDGILVYPGTEWNMTMDEVLKALNITEYGILSSNYGFILFDQTFLGQTADIAFHFTRHTEDTEWGLSSVEVSLEGEAAANAVWEELYQALGKPDLSTSGVASGMWYSDIRIEDLVSPEAWAEYRKIIDGQELAEAGKKLLESSSSIIWLGDSPPNPSNQVIFDGNIAAAMQIEAALGSDPIAQVRSLLGENGDPEQLAALTYLWNNAGFQESKAVAPFIPEIVDCVQADADTVLVYYRRPGAQQLYQTVLVRQEGRWVVAENILIFSMADYAGRNPRELTEEELNAFRSAFTAHREDGSANPAACFLLPCYADISEMNGNEFLAYFPTDQEGTREEFDLLKEKYPEFFEHWTFETMPISIHCYSAREIEAVVTRYANIHWAELDEGVHYLDETGCYYNYTSDFGLGGFYARGGFVYDGGAVVYGAFSALFLTETMGQYSIQAHLPALGLLSPSSHPMIPAEG